MITKCCANCLHRETTIEGFHPCILCIERDDRPNFVPVSESPARYIARLGREAMEEEK